MQLLERLEDGGALDDSPLFLGGMALLAPDAYRHPGSLIGTSWEPPRSTSDRRSEVLRGGSHEVTVMFRWGPRERVRCRGGGTGG
jgi:hypothetical protein